MRGRDEPPDLRLAVQIHESRVQSASETLPYPLLVLLGPDVIYVGDDDFAPVGRGWVGSVTVLSRRRYPIGRAVKQRGVRDGGARHPDRMLSRFASLVRTDEFDHVVLPWDGSDVHLVTYFVEHIVQIVDCINNLPHVLFLDFRNLLLRLQCVDLWAFAIVVPIPVDTIDVIRLVERMPSPGISDLALLLDAPTLKQHHGHVNAALPSDDDTLPQPIEVLLIEPGGCPAGPARRKPHSFRTSRLAAVGNRRRATRGIGSVAAGRRDRQCSRKQTGLSSARSRCGRN